MRNVLFYNISSIGSAVSYHATRAFARFIVIVSIESFFSRLVICFVIDLSSIGEEKKIDVVINTIM